MKIGSIELDSPFVVSPMAGMTDTAFRRLVKRQGGCGLVVSEMVSSEGLVRGIDRTLEYAEYTEEERPVSIQIFGGEPDKMAEAARVVEAMGANIVDVNMGCPVPKIAKHNAGCSLMREPHHAAEIIAAMARAVSIPVTVKMRKGWDDDEVNAPELAKRVEAAGAAAITVHGRTAKQSYSGSADWDVVAGIARSVSIPVFGSGDCVEPEDIVTRMRSGVSGVFVGRGVLRNPWILAQARDLMAGRPARQITEKGEQEGFRHLVLQATSPRPQASKDRWVVNKLRALCAWYTKGFEGGAQFRIGINSAKSIAEVEELVANFFFRPADRTRAEGMLAKKIDV
jgi:tRNA-dihydrouridine synthase B